MTPQEYCWKKISNTGSGHYWSVRLAPRKKRLPLAALLAFHREVDEIKNECSDVGIAQRKLGWWRDEIAGASAGRATHPVCRALQPVIDEYALPKDRFIAMIDSVSGDIGAVRVETFGDLRRRCGRTAMPLAYLLATVLGHDAADTPRIAGEMGIAMRLMEIIRDAGMDTRHDRIYIPAEELRQFSVTENDIMSGIENAKLAALMAHQADRAEHLYQQARVLLPEGDRRAQLPLLAHAVIMQANLEEIRSDGFHVLSRRITLSPLRSFWIAWRAMRRENTNWI